MKQKISLLFCSTNNISSRFTLYPIWISTFRKRFDFFDDGRYLLSNDKNQTLVVFSKYFRTVDPENRSEFLDVLRTRYKKLIFFEDNAGSESEYLGYLPYFDLYFKKQGFKDKSLYGKVLHGNKIFTDFYHSHFGVQMFPNPSPFPRPDLNELEAKFRIGWNLAIGQYHNNHRWNRPDYFPHLYKYFGPWLINKVLGRFPFNKKCPIPDRKACQARFIYQPNRSAIDFQRKLFLELINGNPLFVSGRISKSEYNLEIKSLKAVLSPFGFGEVCFRDFEAILNGSVLVKPDMSHIETWPEIYVPNQTYLPVSWDGSDLVKKVEGLLENESQIGYLRQNAWDRLEDAYLNLEDRVSYFLSEIDSIN
ncbi:hypothetical protein C943_01346 [Mariniradius saccharolyticus AK6]|uniref:Glycosyltransferase family 1 protein n=1 Tax=Mariniradius saccharolyticus AK6 TaxID=1239962 RepID=M7XB08_9BACT|nr:glycosyltransferase [Mariniradius saccharolyticus]EMS32084.1 hypothetical protein C943_01346 [Mariniradius saccharolyticus AK6]